ncbi:hypothetical protein [Massilia sp. DWR3-1-1]|uniref:HzsA-related protein n=1 Tax=Massilia sp. DWR3-1-1 TaxID=2804559 RepID=UPI003CF2A4B7
MWTSPAHAATPAPYPILFVTQVPLHTDVAARLSAFANHLTGPDQVPRGGDLMLRYPDGTLRALTREAGFGNAGMQGAGAIAVREPAVHRSGRRALFSMLTGAPTGPGDKAAPVWQLYEVRGLQRRQRAVITRLAGQAASCNNLSPLYGSDDRVLFTSDCPRGGAAQAHLYPALDEYEASPTTSGIWQLDPATGALRILNHAVSGAFTPILDSDGRVVFTRWDHQQQDQLAQRDRDAARNGVALPFNSGNRASEQAGAPLLPGRDEVFPESRSGSRGPYGEVSAFATNFFTLWQMEEDGRNEETLNHVGQHELAFGYLTPTFKDDPALSNHTNDRFHRNRLALRREGGLFHAREEPRRRGSFVATAARESAAGTATFTTGQLVRLSGAPGLNGERMMLIALTAGDPADALPGGRYRNPAPLADGRLIASHSRAVRAPEQGASLPDLRLVWLVPGHGGLLRAGAPLTSGIGAAVRWWSPAGMRHFDGVLWELDAVELRPRARTRARHVAGFEAPELAVLREERVAPVALRAWLIERDLALIVTRDQTSRDRADLQQPFNLRVPGGVTTVSIAAPTARRYDIAHFQLFQADAVRAYPGRPGRRALAQPLHDGAATAANRPNRAGPVGSVKIAADGSTAAFVPARRALTWQTVDPAGTPVVRERNWITFQAGEMRTCASCHGTNTANQAGLAAPMNKPEALRELLRHWKTLPP